MPSSDAARTSAHSSHTPHQTALVAFPIENHHSPSPGSLRLLPENFYFPR